MEYKRKILFWLYRSKLNSKGVAPIYMRLTIDAKRTEVATGHFAKPEKWDIKKGEVKGKSEEAIQINQLQSKGYNVNRKRVRLDIHSNMVGNSFTNWSKLTPRHNEFIQKILHRRPQLLSFGRHIS